MSVNGISGKIYDFLAKFNGNWKEKADSYDKKDGVVSLYEFMAFIDDNWTGTGKPGYNELSEFFNKIDTNVAKGCAKNNGTETTASNKGTLDSNELARIDSLVRAYQKVDEMLNQYASQIPPEVFQNVSKELHSRIENCETADDINAICTEQTIIEISNSCMADLYLDKFLQDFFAQDNYAKLINEGGYRYNDDSNIKSMIETIKNAIINTLLDGEKYFMLENDVKSIIAMNDHIIHEYMNTSLATDNTSTTLNDVQRANLKVVAQDSAASTGIATGYPTTFKKYLNMFLNRLYSSGNTYQNLLQEAQNFTSSDEFTRMLEELNVQLPSDPLGDGTIGRDDGNHSTIVNPPNFDDTGRINDRGPFVNGNSSSGRNPGNSNGSGNRFNFGDITLPSDGTYEKQLPDGVGNLFGDSNDSDNNNSSNSGNQFDLGNITLPSDGTYEKQLPDGVGNLFGDANDSDNNNSSNSGNQFDLGNINLPSDGTYERHLPGEVGNLFGGNTDTDTDEEDTDNSSTGNPLVNFGNLNFDITDSESVTRNGFVTLPRGAKCKITTSPKYNSMISYHNGSLTIKSNELENGEHKIPLTLTITDANGNVSIIKKSLNINVNNSEK